MKASVVAGLAAAAVALVAVVIDNVRLRSERAEQDRALTQIRADLQGQREATSRLLEVLQRQVQAPPAPPPAAVALVEAPGAGSRAESAPVPAEPEPRSNPPVPLAPGTRVDELAYDGRVHRDLTVLSVSRQTVSFRRDREIIAVPLHALPEELRLRAWAQVGTLPPPLAPVARAPAGVGSSGVSGRTAANDLAADDRAREHLEALVTRAAFEKADTFFRYEYRVGSGNTLAINVRLELDRPEMVAGWEGRWRVTGRGYLAFYESAGRSFSTTSRQFEVLIRVDARGRTEVLEFALR